MIPIHRKIFLNALKAFDLLVMIFSFTLNSLIVYYQTDTISFNQFLSMRIELKKFVYFQCSHCLAHLFFLLCLYHSKRLPSRWKEKKDIVEANTLGNLLILLWAILFEVEMVAPFIIGNLWITPSGVNSLSHLTLRYVLKHFRMRRKNLRNVLIFVTSPRAIRFARRIEAKPELGYHLMGFVDNDWAKNQEFKKEGYA